MKQIYKANGKIVEGAKIEISFYTPQAAELAARAMNVAYYQGVCDTSENLRVRDENLRARNFFARAQ